MHVVLSVERKSQPHKTTDLTDSAKQNAHPKENPNTPFNNPPHIYFIHKTH
jgi:hypothetical protein